MSERALFAIQDQGEAERIVRDAAVSETRFAWTDATGRSGSGRLMPERTEIVLATEDVAVPSGETRIAFVLYGVPFFASCTILDGRLKRPLQIWSADNRASMRVSPGALIRLEWYSPDQGGMRVDQAPIIELGGGGARSLHPPGTPVPSANLFAATVSQGGAYSNCMAEVRSRTVSNRGVELGLRLLTDDPTPFAEIMLRTLFPRITLRRNVDPDLVVRLFEISRYLGLRDGCRPSPGWLGLDADRISRDLTYVASDGCPVGHVSITRAYRHGWLGHQIATLSDHEDSLDARRCLYLSFAMLPGLLDGAGAKLLGYYDRTRPWHQIFFEQFVRSVSSPEIAALNPLDRFERQPGPLVLDTEIPPYIQIEEASGRDLAIAAELARRHTPTLLAEALDLRPAGLRSDCLHPAYEGTRWTRKRNVLLLRVRDKPAGVALCEVTTRDLSLFNIMNMAQFFMADRVEPIAQRIFQHRVRQFYAERAIIDPLVVAPAGTFDGGLDPEVRLAETMGCVVWSTEGLRAFENYARLRFAWLQKGSLARKNTRSEQDLKMDAESA
jgi:hypothetical protein